MIELDQAVEFRLTREHPSLRSATAKTNPSRTSQSRRFDHSRKSTEITTEQRCSAFPSQLSDAPTACVTSPTPQEGIRDQVGDMGELIVSL